MSRDVLIKDLKAKGEEQIAALWREARQEAEKFRAEAEGQRAGEAERCDLARGRHELTGQRRRIMAARRRAEAVTTKAEQELSERLFALARALLEDEKWRGGLLKGWAAELPPGEWGRIRVNPGDAGIAAELFPQAEIEVDPQIPGGLAATSRDGRVTIDNTLSTRLSRIWSRLAPELLREAEKTDAAG